MVELKVSTPAMATSPSRKSRCRTERMRRSGARFTSPMAATRTIAPRMGWARSASREASRVRVRTAIAAVTSSATWVLAPAPSLMAVWEVPPPAG